LYSPESRTTGGCTVAQAAKTSNLRHEIIHILHHAFRIVIVEIEPEHQPVFRIKPLGDLRCDHLRIADERVAGGPANFLFVERSLQSAPVIRQRLPRFLGRTSRIVVDENQHRARHQTALPAAAIGVIGRAHPLVRLLYLVAGRDREIEHTHGQDGVRKDLRRPVVRSDREPEQIHSRLLRHDLQIRENPSWRNRNIVDGLTMSTDDALPVGVAAKVAAPQSARRDHR
jgi:hypothetical protein